MPSVTSLQGQRLWLVCGGNSAREESTDHLPLGCWTTWSPYGVGWAGAASPYRQRASEGTAVAAHRAWPGGVSSAGEA